MNTNIYCIYPKPTEPASGTVALWRGSYFIWFNQLGNHMTFNAQPLFTGLADFLNCYDLQVCSQKQALFYLYKLNDTL